MSSEHSEQSCSSSAKVAEENTEIQDVLHTFTELRQYSQEIEDKIKTGENKAIKQYLRNREAAASVQDEVADLNETLARMEKRWLEMENNLGFIKKNLPPMQEKSLALSQEQTDRERYKGQVSQLMEDLDVPDLIIGIGEIQVADKEFLPRWQTLAAKIDSMNENSFDSAESYRTIKNNFAELKIQSFKKIKTYLSAQIIGLGRSKISFHARQDHLLKRKELFEYLQANDPILAEQLVKEYVNIMNKLYCAYYESYTSKLETLVQEENVSEDDLIGIKDISNNSIFTIGSRENILDQQKLKSGILYPRPGNDDKYPFEALFRSLQYSLVHNMRREHAFLIEYFLSKPNEVSALFHVVADQTLNFLQNKLDASLSSCYDSIAIFVCFNLALRFKKVCEDKKILALNDYWETVERLLFSRLSYVIHLNINSIKDYDTSKFNFEPGPHYITKRYADLFAAFVAINDKFPNENISNLLSEFDQEMEMFISRITDLFPDRKDQLIFIINNYDKILCKVVEKTGDESKYAQIFKRRLASNSTEYSEIVLHPYFSKMIEYVEKCENFLKQSNVKEYKKMEAKSQGYVQDFMDNWKKSLEDLNRDILLSFPNLATGSILFEIAFAQLVQYFNRFHMLLPVMVRSNLVSIRVITDEVKKYNH